MTDHARQSARDAIRRTSGATVIEKLPDGAATHDRAKTDAGLFDRLPDPHLALDGALAIVTANAAWRKLFAPGDLRQCEQLIRALVIELHAGGRRVSPVFRLDVRTEETDEGGARPRYWQMHASLLPATPNEPALIAVRFDDVTAHTLKEEEDRREKALLRSRARLRQLLVKDAGQRRDDHASTFEQALARTGVGVWQVDVTSGIIDCSERCLRDLGVGRTAALTKEGLLGERTGRFVANWRALQSGRPVEFELKVQASEERFRWVLIRGIGQFDEDGTMRSVVGFTLDITGRKEHELELDALADSERTGRERSDAFAKAMDQFIAAVSHELRSPLNAIVSWAELLQLAADPASVVRAGEAIRRNGRQLSRMVDDLLDSGAVGTGKLSMNMQPVDLGALTATVVEDARKLIEHKGLRLGTSDIFPCTVMADDNRMKQVVWNLLTNAVKFTDAGSIEVSVILKGDCAELVVRDTGRGIEADALPLIFDRFLQVAQNSGGRVGGLGLGLWLAKHIVNLHAGTITVVSDGLGQGACFVVRIPAMTSHIG